MYNFCFCCTQNNLNKLLSLNSFVEMKLTACVVYIETENATICIQAQF
jgi:hypothetical protein